MRVNHSHERDTRMMPTVLLDACRQQNCLMLNPLRPDLWCRTCLIAEIEKLRLDYSRFTGYRRAPLFPSDYDY
jgi:hypothetical protein